MKDKPVFANYIHIFNDILDGNMDSNEIFVIIEIEYYFLITHCFHHKLKHAGIQFIYLMSVTTVLEMNFLLAILLIE